MVYIYIIQSLKTQNKYKIGITFILPELLLFKLNNCDSEINYKLIFEGELNKKINALTVETTIHDYLKELKLWEKEDIFLIKNNKILDIIKSIESIIV